MSAADAPGEPRQHLIRAGPLAIHQAVRQPPGPLPDRLERQRDHDGREGRQQQAVPVTNQRADARDQPG